jgi:hypothetical protein
MLRMAMLAACVAGLTGTGALAQPPGRDFEKKDFPGKGERKAKEDGKRDVERPGDPLQSMEAELQRLRARTAEVEEKLAQLRKERAKKAEAPMPREKGPDVYRPFGSGTGAPGGLGGSFGSGGGGPGRPGRPGGAFGPGGMGFPEFGGGFRGPDPFSQMSADQLRTMIDRLQKALDAKTRKADERGHSDRPKEQPRNREGASNEDVLRRLEEINRELEAIRRSLKR